MGSRKALIPFRDQRKPICEVAVAALHELPLSRPAAALSPPCGERAGRGVPIWFMVPMHAEKRKGLSMNRTPHPFPLAIRGVAGGRSSGQGWLGVLMLAERR